MNKTKMLPLVLLSCVLLLGGCAAQAVSPVTGFIYSDVKAPLTAVASQTAPSKKGTAEVTSVLGLFAFGDASIETAAKEAGITEIHHVDYHSTVVLGLFAKYKVTVYGN